MARIVKLTVDHDDHNGPPVWVNLDTVVEITTAHDDGRDTTYLTTVASYADGVEYVIPVQETPDTTWRWATCEENL